MKLYPRKAIATTKAREIHQKLEIEEPDEIQVEKIANYYNIRVTEEPLSGMDGCIVRDGERAVITIRSTVGYQPQKRFIVAHELGHFFLHSKTRQIETVTQEQTSNWSERDIEEYEANLFAADLLMPPVLFTPRFDNNDLSLNLVESLAREFQTTFTSTAVQLVLNSREECALISSQGRQRKWAVRSPGFSFHLSEDGYIHGCSCAAEVMRTRSRSRASDIEASYWLDGFRRNHKALITEDSRFFPKIDRTLTLLWIHDEI
ncbi:MAG: ImmA/IrrE family metallo-endopeptidase [Terrimicrobiaceae bacterium]